MGIPGASGSISPFDANAIISTALAARKAPGGIELGRNLGPHGDAAASAVPLISDISLRRGK